MTERPDRVPRSVSRLKSAVSKLVAHHRTTVEIILSLRD